jgi:hypothetical protein
MKTEGLYEGWLDRSGLQGSLVLLFSDVVLSRTSSGAEFLSASATARSLSRKRKREARLKTPLSPVLSKQGTARQRSSGFVRALM